MHVDPATLGIILAAGIPLLVAVVTKWRASPGLKTYVLLGLSAAAGVVTQVVAAKGDFTWQGVLKSFAEIAVIAIATHYGVYKPTGVSAAVNDKTCEFGIGKPVTP